MKQLDSDFQRVINWNKYKSQLTQQAQKRYLDYLIDPSFQGVNRLFVLFENSTDREVDNIFSSKSKNKRLLCYDWWKKSLCLTSTKRIKNIW